MEETVNLSDAKTDPSAAAGFTLIEILVTLGIIAVVAWVILVCICFGFRGYVAGRDQIRMQQFGQFVIEELVWHLGEARDIRIDADGQGVAFQTPDGAFHYYLERDAGNLKRTCRGPEETGRPNVLNPPDIEVVECLFADCGNTVRIDLSLQSRWHSGHRRAAYRLETDVPVPNRS